MWPRAACRAGSMSRNDYLMSLSACPKVEGGLRRHGTSSGVCRSRPELYLVQKLESILQAAPAVACQYLLETLDKEMATSSKMEAAADFSELDPGQRLPPRQHIIQDWPRATTTCSRMMKEIAGYRSVERAWPRATSNPEKD